MSERFFVMHGHFYQPLREDPWTGEVPPEWGADPYDNFNQKITVECYQPNAALGNLDVMSFDFGPTLLQWLEGRAAPTYRRIIDTDRWHQTQFGVGNALAQAYHHTILPLATRRDKRTQVAWAIADFEHRFGHRPEGMWLPEMAVDYETLEVLAEQGIAFTLLSPSQADGDLDISRPHWVELCGGHRIAIFFRQESLSNLIAFQPQVTENATTFADRHLTDALATGGQAPLLVLAMDGETFGHHQYLRQYFLQALLYSEASRVGYTVTSLGPYLRRHPPSTRVEIVERSSWSCPHGLARWQKGCTCTPGNSQWKGILRQALDRLAEGLDGLYEAAFRRYGLDPWLIRDRYAVVMLGQVKAVDFLREWTGGGLTQEEERRLLDLLAAQPSRQAMFTSCGWFFEDLSRLETRYILTHAARAIALTAEATDVSLADHLRQELAAAHSWITEETGVEIFEQILTANAKSL